MSDSVARVEAAAKDSGLAIAVRRMGMPTRTAEEAAAACNCEVAQIVKSLIFKDAESGAPLLFLVGGDARLDLARAEAACGTKPARADAAWVREVTGFAIGGVSPLGHKTPPRAFIDHGLMRHDAVWAAAGAQDAVFETAPRALAEAIGAQVVALA